jgi:hypothetical protein
MTLSEKQCPQTLPHVNNNTNERLYTIEDSKINIEYRRRRCCHRDVRSSVLRIDRCRECFGSHRSIAHLVGDPESFAGIRVQRTRTQTETDALRAVTPAVTLFAIQLHAMFSNVRRVEQFVAKCCKSRSPTVQRMSAEVDGQTGEQHEDERHERVRRRRSALTSFRPPCCRTVRRCPS